MRRLVATLAAAAVLAAAFVGCGGSDGGTGMTTAAAGGRAEPFLGVSPGLPLLDDPRLLARELPVMAAAGVTSLRVPFDWAALEPRRGAIGLAATDRIVAGAARAGLDVLPVVLRTPAWAALDPGNPASPPKDPASIAPLLRSLIARYGPAGSLWRERPGLRRVPVRAWQIWNEPSHDYYWSVQPWAPSYVRLLRAAHAAIASADPDALTVMAGFPDRSWESLRAVLRAGAGGSFDVAALHPYTAKVANVARIVRYGRAALRAGGEGAVPIWLTEVAWSSGAGKVRPDAAFGFETTEQGQADRLGAALMLLAGERQRLGIGRIYVETWSSRGQDASSTWDWAGLREVRGTSVRPKPAFRKFVEVARALRREAGITAS